MNLADRDFLAFSLKLSSFFWDQSTHSLAATLAVLEPLFWVLASCQVTLTVPVVLVLAVRNTVLVTSPVLTLSS